MPPRLRLKNLQQLAELHVVRQAYVCQRCQHMASTAGVTPTPAPTPSQMTSSPQMTRYSPVQPPSHRDPKYRKSQLLRSYVSLLQTTPLLILFQHNNLKSMEWVGVRRELSSALGKIDDEMMRAGKEDQAIGRNVTLSIIQTNIFTPALRIAEYYRPGSAASTLLDQPSTSSTTIHDEKSDPALTHALSESAYSATRPFLTPMHPLATLLSGPVAVLSFPMVSPAHVKTALSILAPDKANFRAPRKASAPGLYEANVQDGLKKLMLLGARVDGRVFDVEGVKWMAGIEGGTDGLRAQLVALLQGFGANLTHTLNAAGQSIWATMEARRMDMQGPAEEQGEKEKDKM